MRFILASLISLAASAHAISGSLQGRADLVQRSYPPANGGCMPGHTLCDPPNGDFKGLCANLKIDEFNCGACDVPCIGGYGRCIDGVCAANQTCPEGLKGCYAGPGNAVEYQCVDIKTDNWNCGNCQRSCRDGTVCRNGDCVADPNETSELPPWETKCESPFMYCEDRFGAGNGCVNPQNDNRNCGICQKQCDTEAGQQCVNGQCTPYQFCREPLTFCGSIGCANTQNDNQNCGTCGTKCGVGKNCVNGACV